MKMFDKNANKFAVIVASKFVTKHNYRCSYLRLSASFSYRLCFVSSSSAVRRNDSSCLMPFSAAATNCGMVDIALRWFSAPQRCNSVRSCWASPPNFGASSLTCSVFNFLAWLRMPWRSNEFTASMLVASYKWRPYSSFSYEKMTSVEKFITGNWPTLNSTNELCNLVHCFSTSIRRLGTTDIKLYRISWHPWSFSRAFDIRPEITCFAFSNHCWPQDPWLTGHSLRPSSSYSCPLCGI